MTYKIGDRVILKKEKGEGVIIKFIKNNKILVRLDDGFEREFFMNNLIKVDDENFNENAYGEHFFIKDNLNKKNTKKRKVNKKEKFFKIDLHIEVLTKSYTHMSNYDIVQFQINEMHKQINIAIHKREQRIIIVHGIGSGVLKEEVHKELNKYNYKYYLLQDGGSTELLLN